jgi:hypothetical protein
LEAVLPLIGTVIVLCVLLDVFATVLVPTGGLFLVHQPVVEATWSAYRLAARFTRGLRRRAILSYAGPACVVATLAAWLFLMIVGWAMIYYPSLGAGIKSVGGNSDRTWITALYFSGFNMSTLGVGDIVPVNDLSRMMTVIQSAAGFAFFGLSVTYFLSLYSTVIQRMAFTQALHHSTRGTGEGAALALWLLEDSEASVARSRLECIAGQLRDVLQAYRFYPVLVHFHYRERYHELQPALKTILDCVSLLQAQDLLRTPLLEDVRLASHDLLMLLVEDEHARSGDGAVDAQDYADAVAHLQWGGVATAADRFEAYAALRRSWEGPLRALAERTLLEP